MKHLNRSAFRLRSVLLISFFFIGCVSDPVKLDWPANHPANPETQEAEFIRPQNPFESNMAGMKKAPDDDSTMKHSMPQESGMQHMDHNMGTDAKNPSGSASKIKPEQPEGHNPHQEHSQ